jgi:hypothetical protein
MGRGFATVVLHSLLEDAETMRCIKVRLLEILAMLHRHGYLAPEETPP